MAKRNPARRPLLPADLFGQTADGRKTSGTFNGKNDALRRSGNIPKPQNQYRGRGQRG